MRLVAGRDLQGGRLDLDEVAIGEPVADGRGDGVAQEQPRAAVGVDDGASTRARQSVIGPLRFEHRDATGGGSRKMG